MLDNVIDALRGIPTSALIISSSGGLLLFLLAVVGDIESPHGSIHLRLWQKIPLGVVGLLPLLLPILILYLSDKQFVVKLKPIKHGEFGNNADRNLVSQDADICILTYVDDDSGDGRCSVFQSGKEWYVQAGGNSDRQWCKYACYSFDVLVRN